jgi:hypothetical protein
VSLCVFRASFHSGSGYLVVVATWQSLTQERRRQEQDSQLGKYSGKDTQIQQMSTIWISKSGIEYKEKLTHSALEASKDESHRVKQIGEESPLSRRHKPPPDATG